MVVRGLPRGCELCAKGSKAVVFVTGLCDHDCYYCPLSSERRGRDGVFVNEERVKDLNDVVSYVSRLGATSASITGGEPLVKLERALKVIRLLKTAFGSEFHIHMYTNGKLATKEVLESLDAAGLDELRFHPVDGSVLRKVELAVERTSMSVGAEIPAIPGSYRHIVRLASQLEEMGAEFLNLNELEVTETNYYELMAKGFRVDSSCPYVADGSYETALRAASWASKNLKTLKVHVCPAAFKDAVQTRARLLRQARVVRKPYEIVSEHGLLKRVEIVLKNAAEELAERVYKVNIYADLCHVRAGREVRICTAPELRAITAVLDTLRAESVNACEIVATERYPTLSREITVTESRLPLEHLKPKHGNDPPELP